MLRDDSYSTGTTGASDTPPDFILTKVEAYHSTTETIENPYKSRFFACYAMARKPPPFPYLSICPSTALPLTLIQLPLTLIQPENPTTLVPGPVDNPNPAPVSNPGSSSVPASVTILKSRSPSRTITDSEVGRLFCAARIAYIRGLPLNLFWTLHLSDAYDFDDSSPYPTLSRFLKLQNDWLGKKSQFGQNPPSWLAVLEAYPVHAHAFSFLPIELRRAFYDRVKNNWLPEMGIPWTPTVFFQEPITGALTLDSNPERYLFQLRRTLRYCCKDCSPETRRRFGITHPPSNGLIIGKRTGFAEHLSWRQSFPLTPEMKIRRDLIDRFWADLPLPPSV